MKKKFFGLMLAIAAFACGAKAQNDSQDSYENHKVLSGVYVGFTENKVDIPRASMNSNRSFYVPGFRIAVMDEVRLGSSFSLRVMPGISVFGCNWEADFADPVLHAATFKVESVCGEIPVDVKFHPFRKGCLQPYIASGLSYGYDFATLREDSGNDLIHRASPHDLRFNCGLGLDCYTRYLKVGVELKAGFRLLSPGTPSPVDFYFQGGPAFSLGINIEG